MQSVEDSKVSSAPIRKKMRAIDLVESMKKTYQRGDVDSQVKKGHPFRRSSSLPSEELMESHAKNNEGTNTGLKHHSDEHPTFEPDASDLSPSIVRNSFRKLLTPDMLVSVKDESLFTPTTSMDEDTELSPMVNRKRVCKTVPEKREIDKPQDDKSPESFSLQMLYLANPRQKTVQRNVKRWKSWGISVILCNSLEEAMEVSNVHIILTGRGSIEDGYDRRGELLVKFRRHSDPHAFFVLFSQSASVDPLLRQRWSQIGVNMITQSHEDLWSAFSIIASIEINRKMMGDDQNCAIEFRKIASVGNSSEVDKEKPPNSLSPSVSNNSHESSSCGSSSSSNSSQKCPESKSLSSSSPLFAQQKKMSSSIVPNSLPATPMNNQNVQLVESDGYNGIGSSYSHSTLSSLICPYCSMNNLIPSDFVYHITLYHSSCIPISIDCCLCGRKGKRSFFEHLLRYHMLPDQQKMNSDSFTNNYSMSTSLSTSFPSFQTSSFQQVAEETTELFCFVLVVVKRLMDNKFLLVQECSDAGFYLPGGRLNSKELPLKGAVRLVKLKTKIDVEIKRLIRIEYTPHKGFTRIRFILYAEPTDEGEGQLPKSLPDQFGFGAVYMDPKGLNLVKFRGEEPERWIPYVVNGGETFSLSAISMEGAPITIPSKSNSAKSSFREKKK